MNKLIALIFLACTAAAQPRPATKVTKQAATIGLLQKHDDATSAFNASLTADQIRLRDAVTRIEGALQLLGQIAQDSVAVSTSPTPKGKK